ncbi:MAG: carboxypeptidase regulatory-like domain-containing protein [Candidatus Hydrogenedentes bacterium]|nr:carboxypeptidase regulatory-like domain-containing protein [Candidatus Hydrogenedentota bacterium]
MRVGKHLILLFIFGYFVLMSIIASSSECAVAGRVVDEKGTPIKNADVFCEQGLFAPLLKVLTNEDGEFKFTNLLSGPTGLFATLEGFSWGGSHINLPPDENVENLEIVLTYPNVITGRALFRDEKGKEIPVEGVEVTRFAILGNNRVSIPLNKLGNMGYRRVFSDSQGNFVLDKVPSNTLISLKLEHPDFAILSTEGNMAGEHLVVSLEKGCLVLGSVYMGENGAKKKVPGARVMIKSVKPPFETTCVTTNTRGEFTVRVRQGNYLCFAQTEKYVSSGWTSKSVINPNGEYINLPVFPSVNVSGVVRDAITGEPVRGVRIYAEQGGQKVGIVNTGKSGRFTFKIAKGYLTIKFDSIPGYALPTPSLISMAVAGNEDLELPGIWVKKLDSIRLVVKGTNEVKWGFISMLNPYQFGWISLNNSSVEIPIASLPNDNKLIGWVLLPEENLGHVFVLETSSLGKLCEIELSKNASATIDCLDSNSNRVSGIALDCVLVDDDREYKLFRTFSHSDEAIRLEGIPSRVPLRFKILSPEERIIWSSDIINLLPQDSINLGTIKIDSYPKADPVMDELDYDKMNFICGNSSDFKSKRSLLVKLSKGEVPFVLDSLKKIKECFGSGLSVGIVLTEDIECEELGIPVTKNSISIRGSVVLANELGKIIFETEGLPLILSVLIKG